MTDRATRLGLERGSRKPRRLLLIAAIVGADLLATIAWGNYRWHQGLAAGADTVLCLTAGRTEGWEVAMQSRACLAIKGKKPPYFPDNLRPQGPPAKIEVRP